MSEWREFRLKKGSKVQVWKIRQVGETLETTHGLLGGQFQKFEDFPGDKGKPDTKAYVNAVDNASFHVSREIRKKEEHGYVEVDQDGNTLTEQIIFLSWDKVLPKNFSSFKPQTDIEPKALEKLHKTGKAHYTRKLDGMCHIACHHSWGWEIYSRRIDLASDRFPNHIAALESSEFEVGTILVGEMVCLKGDKEDFKAISRVCRSLPEETRKLVGNQEVPEPTFVIFDILFHNGVDLKNTTYENRCKLWKTYPAMKDIKQGYIAAVDYYDVTPENWEKTAKDNGWEGFVVTDGASIPGDKFYSFDGDPKRPKGHHKLKPVYTEEVVVYAAVKGSGKRLNTVGAVFTKQLHPETKQWIATGKVGSGFTEVDLEIIEKLCKENDIPILEKDKEAEKLDLNRTEKLLTVELEYGERQPGTQKFRFPVFIRLREDKNPEECFIQRLAPDEE